MPCSAIDDADPNNGCAEGELYCLFSQSGARRLHGVKEQSLDWMRDSSAMRGLTDVKSKWSIIVIR